MYNLLGQLVALLFMWAKPEASFFLVAFLQICCTWNSRHLEQILSNQLEHFQLY